MHVQPLGQHLLLQRVDGAQVEACRVIAKTRTDRLVPRGPEPVNRPLAVFGQVALVDRGLFLPNEAGGGWPSLGEDEKVETRVVRVVAMVRHWSSSIVTGPGVVAESGEIFFF